MSKTSERSAVATPQNDSIRKKRPTQEDKVLEYLRSHGSLTTMEAVRVLYIMNPQQRIKKPLYGTASLQLTGMKLYQ